MTATEFVNAISKVVRDGASHDVISLLEDPPGRRPKPSLIALSQWYNSLSNEDKRRVSEVALMASDHATFGMLAVIDGVRAIEDTENRGFLELRYVNNGQSILLNNEQVFLHELLEH